MRRPPHVAVLWALAAIFIAGCYVVAARADAWLARAPDVGSGLGMLIIDGERLLDCLPEDTNRAGPISGGIRLYANVDVAFKAPTGTADATSLFVVARGRPLRGVWPMLRLHVDRGYAGAFFVSSREWRIYRVDLELAEGRHHFRLAYVNDRPGFPAKRDVDLRAIGVGDASSLEAMYPGLGSWIVKTGAVRFDKRTPSALTDEDNALRLTPRRHTVALDQFDLDTGAGIRGDARVLWSNGSLGRTVVAPEEGEWKLTVRARGGACDGKGPLTLVMLDDDHVVSWEVGERYRDLTARFSLTAGLHEIRLVFDNDRRIPGLCDRNLHVAGLRLEPARDTVGDEGS